jgi:hypothetical protein
MTETEQDALHEKLATRCKLGPWGCWLWQRQRHKQTGWGRLRFQHRRKHTVHRLAAMIYKGYDPASGLRVGHLCGVRHCCNPDHLMFVTQGELLRYAMQKKHLAWRAERNPLGKVREFYGRAG